MNTLSTGFTQPPFDLRDCFATRDYCGMSHILTPFFEPWVMAWRETRDTDFNFFEKQRFSLFLFYFFWVFQ